MWMRRHRARLVLIAVALGAAAALAAVALALLQGASWHRIAVALTQLQQLAAINPAAAGAIYVLLYAATIVCFLPVGPAMGVGGGAILGPWVGAACAVLGATTGSTLAMLLARGVLGRALPAAQRAMIERLRPGLERRGFSVALALRLAVLTPGWLLNLAAGAAGMQVAPFAAATALGVLPAALVYASFGASIGNVLTSPTPPSLAVLVQPSALLPLLALTALAMLPILVQGRSILVRRLRRGLALARRP